MKKIDPPKVGSFQDSDNQKGEIDHDTRDCAHTIKKSLAGNTALDEESSESSDTKDSWQLVLQRHIDGCKQVEVQILGCDINNESNPFSMNIFVKTHEGETISLVVNSLDTIRYLKMKVHDKMDIPTDQQIIFFAGMQLEDTKTLFDYSIDEGDELHLVLHLRRGRSGISVMKKQIRCQVDFSDTVGSLKEKIQEHEGIPQVQQRLTYAGMPIEDGLSLSDCGIQSETTLEIRIPLPGVLNIDEESSDALSEDSSDTIKKPLAGNIFLDTIKKLMTSNTALDDERSEALHEESCDTIENLTSNTDLDDEGSDAFIDEESSDTSDTEGYVLEMKEIDPPKVRSFHDSDNLKSVEECSDTEDGWQMKIHYEKRGYIYGSNQVEVKILRWDIKNESNPFGMNIFVKTLHGSIIGLVVSCLYTVHYLKVKLQKEVGTPPDEQRFIFGGKQLEDGLMLLNYGVHDGDMLYLVLRLRGGGPIFPCFSVLKKQFSCLLELQFSDTVGSLKEKIHELEGIPPAQQSFTYLGKQLEDGHSLSDLGIQSLPRLQINGECSTTNQENRQVQTPGSSWHDSSNPEADMKITLTEILSAIGNFDNAYLIGKGGSAKVYKGELYGKVVAIKRLNPKRDETEPNEIKNFGIEVAALTACDHPNIVKIIGYCMDMHEEEHIIVSEYVARGSLYSLLHARSPDDPIFDWNTRLRIALDIASGMTYLHDNLHIIHRDLKTQNILLDDQLRAKVADLGIVKSRAYNDGEVYTKLIGTRGYLCPHYVATGSVGTYSDVYAFGVILLELISGRKALDNYTLLADWARTVMQNGSHLDLFDPHLVGEIEGSVLNNVAELATKCVASRKEDRPSMEQIHSKLLSMKETENVKTQYAYDYFCSNLQGNAWDDRFL